MSHTLSPSTRRPRVLFVAETVTLAHAARPYVLANTLADSPYDVHMAWSPRYESLFGERAFVEHEIESISSEAFMQSLAKGRPIYDADTLRRYVKDDLRLLDQVKPDIVIGDMRLSLSISARLWNVPYVSLANAYWSPFANVRYTIPQIPLTGMLGVRTAQWFFDRTRSFVFRQHAKPMNKVRHEYGLPPVEGDMRNVYVDADQVWYVDVPGQTAMSDLPASHQFLGPLSWAPALELPSWWSQVPRDRPIVYVTMGSSGRANLLPVILRSLANLPVTVIAATAGKSLSMDQPANAFVTDYLPGDLANDIALLAIGNGGSPITQQALTYATPVLGIPSNLDQHLNMDGIVACNAGRSVRAEHVNVQRIQQVVAAMLQDESLKQGAAMFCDEIRRFPTQERFKTLLGKVLAGQPASSVA